MINLKRIKSDSGYMGFTHAISALSIFLLLIAFVPAYSEFLQFKNIWFLIIAGLTTIGAAMVPDLDNTKSTIKSNLGVIGDILSTGFRATSVVIQSTVKTRKDDSTPNPHRGFWHTIVASILTGVLIFFITKIGGTFSIPVLGEITIGYAIAFIISFILVQLALTTVLNPLIKKNKKSSLFKIISLVLSFLLTLIIFIQLPNNMSFIWLAVSVTLGMIIHILGDTTTTSGTPLLWPIPINGKMWWNIRLSSMKAGGEIEKKILTPLFVGLSVIALIVIIKNGII